VEAARRRLLRGVTATIESDVGPSLARASGKPKRKRCSTRAFTGLEERLRLKKVGWGCRMSSGWNGDPPSRHVARLRDLGVARRRGFIVELDLDGLGPMLMHTLRLHTTMKTRPSPTQQQILSRLLKERSGPELADELEEQTGTRMPVGTFYSTLRRLEEAGWVKVTRDTTDQDGRLRFYQITAKGKQAFDIGRSFYGGLGGLKEGLSRG
jgi:DNA-binding MarR family transcriptional regulator